MLANGGPNEPEQNQSETYVRPELIALDTNQLVSSGGGPATDGACFCSCYQGS